MSFVSHARKRQRLSSPDYDNCSWEPDDDAIQEISRIELTLSQLIRNQQDYVPSTQSQRASEEAKKRRLAAIKAALGETPEDDNTDEQDNLSSQAQSSQSEKRKWEEEESSDSPSELQGAALELDSRAGEKQGEDLSPSPECEIITETDYSKWLEPSDASTLPKFQKLSKIVVDEPDSSSSPFSLPGFAPAGSVQALPGFAKATSGTQDSVWLEPSKDALEQAARKMQDWTKEDEELQQSLSDKSDTAVPTPAAAETPEISRPVLASVSNSPSLSSSRPSTPDVPQKTREFKSPLVGNSSSRPLYPKGTSPGVQNMPLHYPGASRDPAYIAKFGRTPHPLSSTPITATPGPSPSSASVGPSEQLYPSKHAAQSSFSTPVRSSSNLNTPGSGARKRQYKTTFTTPFKPGMRPGEPGHAALLQRKSHVTPKSEAQGKQKLKEKKSCISLKDSGLVPQRCSLEELSDMGVNASELSRINPRTAPFYIFYRIQPQTSIVRCMPTPYLQLGPDAALVHLLQTGRSRATQEWVLNAYTFILWKLAGYACLDPERELTDNRRWSWEEVLRQLEARYKREIEDGVRPPLRAIANGDRNPSAPMVLVVSDIIDLELKPGKPGKAQLEVSDGWYRLRAVIDEPLTRAVRSGKIKVGRKLAVIGAKVLSPKKESMEVLKAYDTISFRLQGNGTHLAPWHAKLGFQDSPYISTLNSLTADGGIVVLMDLIIEKVFPVGYFEFVTGEGGKRVNVGVRCESEEAEEVARWKARREAEEAKLRDELHARWSRWEDLAERLEAAAGSQFGPSEDDMPPDNTEDLFDDLENTPSTDTGAFVRRLTYAEAGWLARFIRSKAERDKELTSDEIESELKAKCPPRDVRSFRSVIVRDAQTIRRPAHRRAQLTIWDIMNLVVTEGAQPGAIEEGQRVLISNLTPCKLSSWMGTQEGSHVYLSTTRQSRITRIK